MTVSSPETVSDSVLPIHADRDRDPATLPRGRPLVVPLVVSGVLFRVQEAGGTLSSY